MCLSWCFQIPFGTSRYWIESSICDKPKHQKLVLIITFFLRVQKWLHVIVTYKTVMCVEVESKGSQSICPMPFYLFVGSDTNSRMLPLCNLMACLFFPRWESVSLLCTETLLFNRRYTLRTKKNLRAPSLVSQVVTNVSIWKDQSAPRRTTTGILGSGW